MNYKECPRRRLFFLAAPFVVPVPCRMENALVTKKRRFLEEVGADVEIRLAEGELCPGENGTLNYIDSFALSRYN